MKLSILSGFALHQLRSIFYGRKGNLLPEGAPAPEFTLQDESGTLHTLSQYRGKKVVLFWYLRANTPG
jgi:hypothetical protein